MKNKNNHLKTDLKYDETEMKIIKNHPAENTPTGSVNVFSSEKKENGHPWMPV